MFSAWNPTDEPEDIMATLYYGDGSGTYHLPIHLAPQASSSVDVAMLVRDKMPDIDGKIIPSNIRDGSASFDTAEKDPAAYDGKKLVTAVISGAVFNVAEATCGMVCTYCNGYNNWVIIPDPINDAIGTSSTNIAQATDSYGNKQTMSGGSWSSSNTGIMTVSSGNTQGISVGQATITDFFNSVIAIQGQFCVNESMPDNCPQTSAGPSGPGNVPPTLAVSPVNQNASIFTGTDPEVIGDNGPNSFLTTVKPAGGTLTVTSSDPNDTFSTYNGAGSPAAVVKTSDQSVNIADRILTFTYTVNNQSAKQTVKVTARQFAYLQPQTLPGNICSLGHGYKYAITYSTYTHPDKKALASNDGVSGVGAQESFDPALNGSCGIVTGSSALDANGLFTDTLSLCSNATIPNCSVTSKQTWSVGGFPVRTNSLTFTNTALTYTSQGPTQ